MTDRIITSSTHPKGWVRIETMRVQAPVWRACRGSTHPKGWVRIETCGGLVCECTAGVAPTRKGG